MIGVESILEQATVFDRGNRFEEATVLIRVDLESILEQATVFIDLDRGNRFLLEATILIGVESNGCLHQKTVASVYKNGCLLYR